MEFQSIGKASKATKLSYLGGVNISAKMIKNQKVSGNLTYIIYLAPAMESGYNLCVNSTPECRLGCLSTSGRAAMDLKSGANRIKNARIAKSKLFFEHNEFYMGWMFAEIRKYQKQAQKKGLDFSVRLNGTSDIDYANFKLNGKNVFETFPEVSFYDYTKQISKITFKPENYNLTFSYSGRNVEQCLKALNSGVNIAVVFNVHNEKELPKTFMGYEVLNGDLTDFRIADTKGCVIGLKWKKIANKADNDKIKTSCFVVQPTDERCGY